jgi:hypothetical protein
MPAARVAAVPMATAYLLVWIPLAGLLRAVRRRLRGR